MTLRLTSPLFLTSTHFVNSFDHDIRRMNNLFKSLERSMQGEVDEHGSRIVTPNYQSHTDENGTQTIEIEMPGVRKDEISVDLDKNGRVLLVTGNRYKSSGSPGPDVGAKDDEKDESTEQGENGKDDKGKVKPALVYKWKWHVDRICEIEDVEAEHCGDGILRILLQSKQRSDEAMKVQIRDA